MTVSRMTISAWRGLAGDLPAHAADRRLLSQDVHEVGGHGLGQAVLGALLVGAVDVHDAP